MPSRSPACSWQHPGWHGERHVAVRRIEAGDRVLQLDLVLDDLLPLVAGERPALGLVGLLLQHGQALVQVVEAGHPDVVLIERTGALVELLLHQLIDLVPRVNDLALFVDQLAISVHLDAVLLEPVEDVTVEVTAVKLGDLLTAVVTIGIASQELNQCPRDVAADDAGCPLFGRLAEHGHALALFPVGDIELVISQSRQGCTDASEAESGLNVEVLGVLDG
jgi:hypothetical protein